MQRIFISNECFQDNSIHLSDDIAHHLFNVCRLKVNDKLELVIDEHELKLVQINQIYENKITVKVLNYYSVNSTRSMKVSLIQSLPKQDKLTDVCRLCTEIGVGHIFPVISDNCDIQSLNENRFRRAEKAIESAAKQSKQSFIPKLEMAMPLHAFLKSHDISSDALKLVAYEKSTMPLTKIVTTTPKEIIIAIGPEGGYSEQDIALFKRYEFKPFSIGNFILRTEHAGFAAMNYIDGFFSSYEPKCMPGE